MWRNEELREQHHLFSRKSLRVDTALLESRVSTYQKSEIFVKILLLSAILVMFLNLKLGYDKDASTALYHSYLFLGNLCTIVGAIVTDGWWGSYNTMIRMSFVLASGAFIVAVGTVDTLNLPIV